MLFDVPPPVGPEVRFRFAAFAAARLGVELERQLLMTNEVVAGVPWGTGIL